jgi:predicted dehydrogenase
VLPYPGVGSLTAAALTDVAVVDATVHGLDLMAAIGGPPPPEAARAHTLGVLVQVPALDELIDVLTGRLDPATVLPVMR